MTYSASILEEHDAACFCECVCKHECVSMYVLYVKSWIPPPICSVCYLCQGETVDSFNWGARRRSIDSLDRVEQRIQEEDESQQSGSSTSLRPIVRHDSDESSEEESLTVSQILASSQLVSQNLCFGVNVAPVWLRFPNISSLMDVKLSRGFSGSSL